MNRIIVIISVVLFLSAGTSQVIAAPVDPTVLDPMDYYQKYNIQNKEIDSDFIKYQKEKNRPYGALSLTFLFLSAGAAGTGVYFELKIGDTNKKIKSMYNQYLIMPHWILATMQHMKIKSFESKNDTKQWSLYRWISYGGAGAFGITAIGLAIKYFTVVSLKKKIAASCEGDVSFDFNMDRPDYIAEMDPVATGFNVMVYSVSAAYRF